MRRAIPLITGFGLVVLLYANPALAMDAASKQAICDDLQKASENAIKANLQNYTPRKDPSKTFSSATKACLDLIVAYNKIPLSFIRIEALQPILQELGRELLTKECNAAAQQFESTINEALADKGLSYSNGSLSYSYSSGTLGTGTVSVDGSGTVSSSGIGAGADATESLLNLGGDGK